MGGSRFLGIRGKSKVKEAIKSNGPFFSIRSYPFENYLYFMAYSIHFFTAK